MPLLNARGDYLTGKGGGVVAVNDVVVLRGTDPVNGAGERAWLDDDTVIAQVCDNRCRLKTYNIHTKQIETVAERGASHLYAGGGVWAAWLGSFGGVYTSTGLELKGAGLGAVGPDGAIAIAVDYQAGKPWDVIEKDGTRWRLTDTNAGNINLLGHGRAVWSEPGGVVRSRSGPHPLVLTVPFFGVRMLFVAGKWWTLYQDATDRLLFHDSQGIGFHVTTGPAFRPDCVKLPNGRVRIAWSHSEGEHPGQQAVKDLNLDDPRVDLREPIIAPPPPPPPPPEEPMPERHHGDVVARLAAQIPHERTLAYAWRLCKVIAWELRSEGCGLHQRPASGENVMTEGGETYGASRVMYRDGDLYKIVSDAGDGGANGPQWAREEPIDPARWRPPLAPDDEPGEPGEPGEEPPTGRTLEDLWDFILKLEQFHNMRLDMIDDELKGMNERGAEVVARISRLEQSGGVSGELIVEGRTEQAGASFLKHSHTFTGMVKARPKAEAEP